MQKNEVELTCESCGKKFNRRKTEAKRNQKLGRRTFCSLQCCGHGVFDNIPPEKRCGADHLKSDNLYDEYSQFRWHLRNAKQRKHECDITLVDLKEQWERQTGICPYTGWGLKNMRTSRYLDQLPLTPDRASLDRIDSSNIANFAKHKWAELELLKFCEAVVLRQKNSIVRLP